MRYELIIPSASRPHLLRPTLESLAKYVDEPPGHIWVHDDAVFPGRQKEVADVLSAVGTSWGVPVNWKLDDPPIRHGPTLAWLLDQVETDFVLYSQDDHIVTRHLPIQDAMTLMYRYSRINQIRFNKRATRSYKDTWRGQWRKQEEEFSINPEASRRDWLIVGRIPSVPLWHCGSAGCDGHGLRRTLTISDHWYFQTGLWRVSTIRAAVSVLRETPEFRRSCEEAVNVYFDQGLVHRKLDPLDPATRARHLGTYIWGPIGEDRFVEHVGGAPEDWAGDHAREELQR